MPLLAHTKAWLANSSKVDMSKMPRFNTRFRPDFEARGPYVEVVKKGEICLEAPPRMVENPADEDDDFAKYKYYESDKILGQLYRAIDEREVFSQIQTRDAAIHDLGSKPSLVNSVWAYVKHTCLGVQWEHHITGAREVRDA